MLNFEFSANLDVRYRFSQFFPIAYFYYTVQEDIYISAWCTKICGTHFTAENRPRFQNFVFSSKCHSNSRSYFFQCIQGTGWATLDFTTPLPLIAHRTSRETLNPPAKSGQVNSGNDAPPATLEKPRKLRARHTATRPSPTATHAGHRWHTDRHTRRRPHGFHPTLEMCLPSRYVN